MRHVVEKVVAIAFSSPKVTPVFFAFFGLVGEVILAKPQYNDLSDFKCQVLSRKEYAVAGDKGQDALVVHR